MLGAESATGQGFGIAGAVAHGGRDGRPPLAGRWTVLHRVTEQGGAPVDSTRTDRSGRYRFRLAAVDTAAVYIVSTEWHGIGYFTAPVRSEGRSADTLETLVVYDTSSSGPALRLVRRLLTVARFQERDGAFAALEAWHVQNPGQTARVASDTTNPVWSITLPGGVTDFQVRDGDVSPEAVVRRGDRAAVFGTIAPGAARQILVTYGFSATTRQVAVPVDQWTGQMELLVEGGDAGATGPALQRLEPETVEGRTFQHFRADQPDVGAVFVITLPAAAAGAQTALPFIVAIVAIVVLLLAGGLYVAFRPRRTAAVPERA